MVFLEVFGQHNFNRRTKQRGKYHRLFICVEANVSIYFLFCFLILLSESYPYVSSSRYRTSVGCNHASFSLSCTVSQLTQRQTGRLYSIFSSYLSFSPKTSVLSQPIDLNFHSHRPSHIFHLSFFTANMKVILTGSTGFIGSEILAQAIDRSFITSIICITRRALPESISSNPKVKVIILKDFTSYPPEVLSQLSGVSILSIFLYLEVRN